MSGVMCLSCDYCLSPHPLRICKWNCVKDSHGDAFHVYLHPSAMMVGGPLQGGHWLMPTLPIEMTSLKQGSAFVICSLTGNGERIVASSVPQTLTVSIGAYRRPPLSRCPPLTAISPLWDSCDHGLRRIKCMVQYCIVKRNLNQINEYSFDVITTPKDRDPFDTEQSKEQACLESSKCGSFMPVCKDYADVTHHVVYNGLIDPSDRKETSYSKLSSFEDCVQDGSNVHREDQNFIHENRGNLLHNNSSTKIDDYSQYSMSQWVNMTKLSASSISVLRTILFLVMLSATCHQTSAAADALIHAIIPHHIEMKSPLSRELHSTVINFKRDRRNSRLRGVFFVKENVTFLSHDTPSEIIDTFCNDIIKNKAVTLININNPLRIRRRTSSNNYILNLAKHLGLPVISWDTEFSGPAKMDPDYRTIQLAPTVQHQARAMVSVLQRYNWTQFTVVTSAVAGDSEFVSALESLVEKSHKLALKGQGKRLELLSHLHIANHSHAKEELAEFVNSDSRVFLLHCSSRASYSILESATALGLTSKEHIWILSRASIPAGRHAPRKFPVGLFGVSFDYGVEAMKQVIKIAMKTALTAMLDMAKKPGTLRNIVFPPELSCQSEERQFWTDGNVLYQHMLNVSIKDEPHIRFNKNGTMQSTELSIMNLQWEDGKRRRRTWREVGRWKRNGLKMEDITWPGQSSVPPSGRPKRAFLRIVTLHELPYVVYRNTSPDGTCGEKTLPCSVYVRDSKKNLLQPDPILRCCVGLSMDLLNILSEELNFDFRIEEVKDASWGSEVNGTWNGLVKALLDDECDMVVTSMKINPERASAIQFSFPYLETGIKIIVALRDGAISPTAFLEPFDYYSWCMIVVLSVNVMGVIIFFCELILMRDPKINTEGGEPYDYASWSLILVFSVHATGSSILIFEWLSPYGLNRGQTSMRDHKFSLFRSFWLIWAMLFSTSVQTDSPRGIASRFLANIWALFALVFLASYTANLAAFMITKEEYYDLSGIQDIRLQNPYVMNPPFKYATTPNGSTEAMLRANYQNMYNYMRSYAQPDVDAGINALKSGDIQAFIYDSSVLEYYASRDPKCSLVTVGNRYAMTGYGIGFPPDPSNPWISKVNKVILKLQENGELDRLQKFWLAGACDFKKEAGVSNRTLGILNFTSAFILLGSGILLGLLLLLLEHVYFMFGRKLLRRWDRCGCCALVSLSMGKSLRMKDYVDEAMSLVAKNRCKDPICETQIWKLKHKLDLALLKIENLENQLSIPSGETGSVRLKSIINNSSRLHNHKSESSASRGSNNHYPNNISNHNSQRQRTPLLNTKSTPSSTKPHRTDTIHEVTFANDKHCESCCIHDNPCPPDDFGSFIQSFQMDPLSGKQPELDQPSPRAWPDDYRALGGNPDWDDKCEECIALNLIDEADSECESTQSTGTTSLGANISGKLSPWPVLKRSPSYTSAIGGSFGSDVDSNRSPNMNRYRQYDGKTYMGVGGVTL